MNFYYVHTNSEQLRPYYGNVTTKEERKSLTQEMSPSVQIEVSYEDFVEALQSLRTNESNLIKQKGNLTNLLNQLENESKRKLKKEKAKLAG